MEGKKESLKASISVKNLPQEAPCWRQTYSFSETPTASYFLLKYIVGQDRKQLHLELILDGK